jgi:hypothetical protein
LGKESVYVNGEESSKVYVYLDRGSGGSGVSRRDSSIGGKKKEEKSDRGVEYDRASWGAAVLRPYMIAAIRKASSELEVI